MHLDLWRRGCAVVLNATVTGSVLLVAAACNDAPRNDCKKPGVCSHDTNAVPPALATPPPDPIPTVTVTASPTQTSARQASSAKPSPRPTGWPICTRKRIEVFLISDRTHYSVKQPVTFTVIVFNHGANCDTLEYGGGGGGVTVMTAHSHVVWPTGPSGANAVPAIPLRQHLRSQTAFTYSPVWSQCTCQDVFIDGAYPNKQQRAAPGTYYASAAVQLSLTKTGSIFAYSQQLAVTLDP